MIDEVGGLGSMVTGRGESVHETGTGESNGAGSISGKARRPDPAV